MLFVLVGCCLFDDRRAQLLLSSENMIPCKTLEKLPNVYLCKKCVKLANSYLSGVDPARNLSVAEGRSRGVASET